MMRINHVYSRSLAVGVAAFAFLRAFDTFSTPWFVPLQSLRVALNAISLATIVVVLHYAIAAASFSFMQKAAAFVVVASWFINGLHWCSRKLCIVFSYLTMLPFFWTYPKNAACDHRCCRLRMSTLDASARLRCAGPHCGCIANISGTAHNL